MTFDDYKQRNDDVLRQTSPSRRMQDAADEHARLMREIEKLKKDKRGAA